MANPDRLPLRPATWTHDSTAGALYFYLAGPIAKGAVSRTVPVDGAMVNADVDAEGRVIGIEVIANLPAPEEEPDAGH